VAPRRLAAARSRAPRPRDHCARRRRASGASASAQGRSPPPVLLGLALNGSTDHRVLPSHRIETWRSRRSRPLRYAAVQGGRLRLHFVWLRIQIGPSERSGTHRVAGGKRAYRGEAASCKQDLSGDDLVALRRKYWPRCGARTRQGPPCRKAVEPGKRRCKFHGGRSTGPRTQAGRARIAAASAGDGNISAGGRPHDACARTRAYWSRKPSSASASSLGGGCYFGIGSGRLETPR
jgi:hypothetical protein